MPPEWSIVEDESSSGRFDRLLDLARARERADTSPYSAAVKVDNDQVIVLQGQVRGLLLPCGDDDDDDDDAMVRIGVAIESKNVVEKTMGWE